jgi:hypothetical protein
MDCFAALGLTPPVTTKEIKAAYKRLAHEHHPDRGGSTEAFQKLQAAYETALKLLCDDVFGAEILDRESEKDADAIKAMHVEASPKLDRASLKALRVTIGRRLLAIRPRWPRSGPRSAGWGLFLDRAGISLKQAERYMSEAREADGAVAGAEATSPKKKSNRVAFVVPDAFVAEHGMPKTPLMVALAAVAALSDEDRSQFIDRLVSQSRAVVRAA